jgi:50S ribosomal protein L16 3-hydroxylase
VGPHTDSYHTFLVQGIGKRTWKISNHKIDDDQYAQNLEMKVLQNGFDGNTYEVTAGDVIYMPPFFGHEGKTIEAAMTFSVGFLGPKLSNILGDYAQYLEANEDINQRYYGEDLSPNSSGFMLGTDTQNALSQMAVKSITSNNFTQWMAEYFSKPSHDDIDDTAEENDLSPNDILKAIESGKILHRQEHVKLTITETNDGNFNLGIYGEVILVDKSNTTLINALNNPDGINHQRLNALNEKKSALDILCALYNQDVLKIK